MHSIPDSTRFSPGNCGFLIVARWAIVAVSAIGFTLGMNAQEGRALVGRWENDSFAQVLGPYADRYYSQGASLLYWERDNELASGNFCGSSWLAAKLPALGAEFIRSKGGISVGQEIYTPECIGRGPTFLGVGYCPRPEEAQLNDRPFAGWLYGALHLQRRGLTAKGTAIRDDFEIQLGIVGPHSLGENAQKWFHSLFENAIEPVGWNNQLKTEPGLLLKGDRRWLFTTDPKGDRWGLDLVPRAGIALGNIGIHANAGALVRAGFALPRDFQVPDTIRDLEVPPAIGIYAFGAIDGRLVGHNLFLDGSSFRNTHQVKKEYFVAEFTAGLGFRFGRGHEMTFSYIRRTEEFRFQNGSNTYLSGQVRFAF